MKKIITFLLINGFCIVFIVPVWGQNISEVNKSQIEKQVDSVFHIMIKYAENLEYDKLAPGVDDKYNAGFITNGSYYTQYDSLIHTLKSKSQGITKQSIKVQREKITVLTESIVILTAFGDSKVYVDNGNTFSVKFFWSFVYEKIDNNWKVIQSHQSGIR